MKKKIIKINFRNFWEGFDPKDNLFINVLKKNYEVEISENPDYMFYSVYQEVKNKKDLSKKGDLLRKISPNFYLFVKKGYSKLKGIKKEQIKAPKGNFVKILHSAENTFPRMEDCDWAFGSTPEEKVKNERYMRIPIYLIDNPRLEKKMNLPFKKKVNFEKIKKEKVKFCNFIYSQEINTRNNFFKRLNKYKKIDSPGRCMNNMGPINKKSPRESRISKEWVEDKLNFLKKYKFTIAFENEISEGWITEKLTHPLLVNSIPIYLGTETVSKDFNTKCFINYNDFKNMNEFIKHIIQIDQEDKLYKNYLSQPIFKTKEQYEFSTGKSFLKRLNEIIEVGNKKKD